MLIFGKLVLRNHFPKSVLTKSIRDDSALGWSSWVGFVSESILEKIRYQNFRDQSDTNVYLGRSEVISRMNKRVFLFLLNEI